MQPKNVRALVVIALMVVALAAAFVDEAWLRAALVVLPALFIAQRALLGAATDSVAGPAVETGRPPGGGDRREDMTVRRHIQQLLELIRDFYATCHMVAVGQLSPAKAKSKAREVEEKLNVMMQEMLERVDATEQEAR